MNIWVSDPAYIYKNNKIVPKNIILQKDDIEDLEFINLYKNVKLNKLENCLENSDYIIITCSLNKLTYHLINREKILLTKKGVKIINVGRGKIVNENDVISLLEENYIDSVAFDVFEEEPLHKDNKLKLYKKYFW